MVSLRFEFLKSALLITPSIYIYGSELGGPDLTVFSSGRFLLFCPCLSRFYIIVGMFDYSNQLD